MTPARHGAQPEHLVDRVLQTPQSLLVSLRLCAVERHEAVAGEVHRRVVLSSLVRRFTVEPFKEYGKNTLQVTNGRIIKPILEAVRTGTNQ